MAAKGVKRAAFKEYTAALRQALDGRDWSVEGRLMVVYGSSDLLLSEAIRQLRDKALATGAVAASVEAPTLTENSLLALAQQTSLFEPATFYTVRRTESAKSLAKVLTRLKNQAQLTNPLCFVYQGDALPPPLSKEFTRLKTRWVPCFAPWPNEVPLVLTALADGLGLRLSQDAMQLLMQAHGDDLVKQANELRKIALILGPEGCREPLNARVLSPHLEMLREDEAQQLDQLLLQHEWAKAHALATALLIRGEKALAVLAILANHCRNIMRIVEAQTRGAQAASLASATRLSPFIIKSYLPYITRNRDTKRFIRALGLCQNADQLLKSRKVAEEMLLARVIDALAQTSYT